MKYWVTLAGRTVAIDLSAMDAELHAVPGTPLRQLVMPGRSEVLALVRQASGAWCVVSGGEHWTAEVVDERTRALRRMTGAAAVAQGPQVIRAPMPGLVLRLEVGEGRRVEPGQGLLVLEAMKMENELKAPAAGVVARVLVTAGQAVEKGSPLLEIAAGDA